MFWNVLANMFCRLLVAHPILMAQRDITNIFIKVMLEGIAIVVRFVGAHRMLVPLAGKHALPTNCLKAATNPANAGKQIDKSKGIMRMMRRWRRQQGIQISKLIVAEAMPCFVRHHSLKDGRTPAVLANTVQISNQGFHVIYFKQLSQNHLRGGLVIICHRVHGACY